MLHDIGLPSNKTKTRLTKSHEVKIISVMEDMDVELVDSYNLIFCNMIIVLRLEEQAKVLIQHVTSGYATCKYF